MKTLSFFSLCAVLFSIAGGRDFRPVWRLENIPAGDSSIQQCYVIQTTPGVEYTVESSNDLSTWTPQEELYGLGNEYVITMREFTPPPTPPPGTLTASPLALPTNVSLRIQPASGAAGGSVVSWSSLDHDGPRIVRIAGEMDLAWNSIPIFWNRFGAYNFYFWHPGVTVAPPAENPSLGPKDTAMLAVLETSVPDINLQIAASILSARNAPLPAPPDPNSKRFWRVKVNADIDTDQDGSPDWAEFEIAARGTGMLVSGVTGDPFDADTNHDGKLDGLQLDADLDSTADASDPDIADNSATFPIGPVPRYALFPITNAMPPAGQTAPFQISDKGTVLYENGTWTANVWTALDTPPEASENGYPSRAKAVGINDSNQIIGVADREITSLHEHDVNNDPSEVLPTICYWNAPNGARTFVSSGNGEAEKFAVPSLELFEHRLTPGPVLSNDGRFSAFIKPRTDWINATAHPGYWKLPEANQPATETSSDHRLKYTQGPNLRWGAGYSLKLDEINSYGGLEDTNTPLERLILAPAALPPPPITAVNVFKPTADLVLALPAADSASEGMALIKGKWDVSATYRNAIDIAADGTAIGRNRDDLIAPILFNGKWVSLGTAAPGLPPAWRDETVNLLDITPGGWILAQRGSGSEANPKQTAVMLPIKVDGVDPDLTLPPMNPPEYLTGGVDHTSMAATGGTGRVQEIWIMAPAGVSKAVRFQSPLNPISKIKMTSGIIFKFTPEEIQSEDEILNIKALVTSDSYTPRIVLGGTVNSDSSPVKIKVMKKRTVRVAIHPVALKKGNNAAVYPLRIPTNSVEDRDNFDHLLTEYLDKVYGQQVNAFFDIQVLPVVEKDFDTVEPAGEIAVASGNEFTPEMTLACADPLWPSSATDIDIWVLGGTDLRCANDRLLGARIGGTFEVTPGSPASETPYAVIDGDELVGQAIAHEIGHVFMGSGHPDKIAENHFARLTGVSQQSRLMRSTASDPQDCQLIKKEWDKIEKWLKDNIDDKEPK